MLRSLEIQARDFRVWRRLRRSKNIRHNHHRRMERHMSNWQHAWRLRRNHAFAAVVTLIGRIAGHGTAALHALLVLRHRGRTVRKLQAQEGDYRHDDEDSLAHYRKSTVRTLDARVNERIQQTVASSAALLVCGGKKGVNRKMGGSLWRFWSNVGAAQGRHGTRNATGATT
jgi:hypothetical protein